MVLSSNGVRSETERLNAEARALRLSKLGVCLPSMRWIVLVA
jgi:hypothetical protein